MSPRLALMLSLLPGFGLGAAGAAAPAAVALPPAAAAPVAAAAAARAPAAQPAANADPLEHLRERLAEKLGATQPAENKQPNVVRVAAKVEAAESSGSRSVARAGAAPGTHAAATAAPRKPSAAVLAALDAHRASSSAAAIAAAAQAPVKPPAHAHWAYGGETGPAAWGGLKPEFALCANGKRQSPIDIRGGIAVDLEPVQFDYRASPFAVVDNGHTVQVNLNPGNHIQVGARRYELVQFHFHRPAEERINGRVYDMSLHLVHKDAEGRTAVVGLLLERGAAQPVVQQVWNNLPLEQGLEQPGSSVMDLNHLLPPDRGYYTYMGSLTTPPCSEGVLWMVMRQPVAVTQAQIDIFSRLYPMNARPVQAASGRLIKQSQ